MFLKSLDMQGFKSFAEKIHIEVDKGITAIVGPNGSGKSNVSDAIRWVMGEMSVKSLRGSKMEDVIFAGTQTRKPMGFAEVTMTLDNSEGELSVDYDEVAICRRVYRSGESEYFINKTPCRLKDIHELLMDTGLGRDGYSVIGQGKIDDVLYSKPEERRQIFEEAAGISKYKYRKMESERKLGQTEENLVRIKDILSELENQVGPLYEQSQKAGQFLNFQSELKVLEVNVSLEQIDRHKKTLGETQAQFGDVQKQLEEKKNQLDKLENDIAALYESMRENEEALSGKKAQKHELELLNSGFDSEITVCENKILNIGQNISRLSAEAEALLQQAQGQADEFGKLQKAIEGLLQEEQRLEEAVAAAAQESNEASARLGEKNAEIEKVRAEISGLSQKAAGAENKMKSYDILLQSFKSRQTAVADDLAAAATEEKTLQERKKTQEAALEKTQKALEAAAQEAQEKSNEAASLAAKTREMEAAYNDLSVAVSQKQSRHRLLSELERDLDGYSFGVKSILKNKNEIPGAKIWGVLGKLIKVPDAYVTAIEVALAAAAQNVVVETEDDAKAAIGYLKSKKAGRVTFLPISAVKSRRAEREAEIRRQKGFVGFGAELVRFEERFSGVVGSLLGAVAVMETMDDAVRLARAFSYKLKIVTLTGEVLNPGGAITGGSQNQAHGLLSRGKEIAALKEEIDKITKKMNKYEDEIENYSEKQNAAESEAQALLARRRQLQEEAGRQESEAALCESLLLNLQEKTRSLEKEAEEISAQLLNSRQDKAQDEKDQKAFLAAQKEQEEVLFALQQELEKLVGERNAASERVVAKTIEKNAVTKDISVYRDREAAFLQNKDTQRELAALKREEIGRLEGEIAALREEIGQTTAKKEENLGKISAIENEIENVSQSRAGGDGRVAKMREDAKACRDDVFLLQSECARMENKISKAQMELDATIDRLWDEYQLTYTTAQEVKTEMPSFSAAKKRIAELKGEIRKLGNINVSAIEEYKLVKERFDFLSEQEQDLQSAKTNLLKIIKEMTGIMQQQFLEKFGVIAAKFSETFVNLLGGGTARLTLCDEENVLESGIEIEVQPPGKKLQNIMLLSGGEKAFVAIALFFALLEVRPSPFCVLDEIEAALDEGNVERFALYMKKYLSKTQFIVITHRRPTMENADVLYGVTMQEKGVSKVLSIRLEETNLK